MLLLNLYLSIKIKEVLLYTLQLISVYFNDTNIPSCILRIEGIEYYKSGSIIAVPADKPITQLTFRI